VGFTDDDDQPIPAWEADPEAAFEAWKKATVGRPLDYTGLTYERLSGGSGIQWPCNDEHPEGLERLYADATFPTSTEMAETFGQDSLTGAPLTMTEYQAIRPDGRAFLRSADYQPARETVSSEFPLLGTTGRTAYHFHTRTKTRHAAQLQNAAPRAWAELSAVDAERLGVSEGDLVEVRSPRGRVQVQARVGRGREGVVFLPFHYGYFDEGSFGPQGDPHAANELTMTVWDPVSKQPTFKVMAVKVTRVGPGETPAAAPSTGASASIAPDAPVTVGGEAGSADSEV
jgi:predicted molibdopterin-dependent oxidoreductase YjgC